MAYSVFDSLSNEQPLVNQSPAPSSYSVFDSLERPQAEPPAPKTPETWFGEFSSGLTRGVDQLQQMAYGGGALAASWMGAEGVQDWFLKGYMSNEDEILKNPASVANYQKVDGMDAAIRYGMATLGEFAPQIGETLMSGFIGAMAGTAIEPGPGTVAGGIGGMVAKGAVKKLITGETKDLLNRSIVREFRDYLGGKVEREALSDAAKSLVTKESRTIASRWGADAAIALSAITKEAGSIYGDTLSDPSVSESDRRWASTVGGVLAAIPDMFVGHYIMGKFFPGVKDVPKKDIAEASGFLARFMAVGGKEILKVGGMESAQEFIQTGIELASGNWANPNTRHDFLNWTPEQWTQMVDASIRGGIGGTFGSGPMVGARQLYTQHPNPAVRSGMRDILQGADDASLIPADVTPEHKALEAVQNKIGDLQAKMAMGNLSPEDSASVQSEMAVAEAQEADLLDKLGMAEEQPLVNQNSAPTETPPEAPKQASPLPTADEAKIESLRALYAQRMPKEEGTYDPNMGIGSKVAEKQADVDNHISSIAGDTDYGNNLRKAVGPHVVRMMASENVHLVTDPDGKIGYGADIQDDGRINLYVPSEETISKTEPEAMAKMLGGTSEDARKDYVGNVEKFIQHEIAHVADLVNQRGAWERSGKQGKLHDFVNQKMIERGARMREAEPSLPAVAKSAYQWGTKGNLSDLQLGQELPRMAIEMARQGRTTEVTEALDAARRNNGKLNAFFRDWIDTIKNIGSTIRKMLDPKTANPDLLRAYHDINQTLDKYGVLVNEKPESTGVPTDLGASAVVIKPSPPAVMLPSQEEQVKAEVISVNPAPVKEQNNYQKFRAAIKTQAPSDVVRSYLDWKGSVPQGKSAVAAAHMDFMQRAPNTTMPLDRFNQIVKERQNEQIEKAKSQPAQKSSSLESGQGSIEEFDGNLLDDTRGEGGFYSPMVAQLAEEVQTAERGGKLAALRSAIIEKHPHLLPHLNNIIKELEEGRFPAPVADPYPVRGEDVSTELQEYKHALFIPGKVREATRILLNARGVEVFGVEDEVPDGHYIIDPEGRFYGDDLVNQSASVKWPVTITNKLIEAQKTEGIPETYALHDLGYYEINDEAIAFFDESFGENNWILKSFSDNALQSEGVAFAEAIKKTLSLHPDVLKSGDTSFTMVQRLHDVAPRNRANNIKILSRNELRIHVITDANGDPHIIPYSTLWKLTAEEADALPASHHTPITVEDFSIRLAQERALDAIRSLPVEDRSGQSFGLDVVRLRDGDWGIVENNPTDQNGMSGFFTGNPMAHDAFISALLGEKPIHAELSELVSGIMETDSSLVNQRSQVAEKPLLSKAAERDLNRALEGTRREFNNRFSLGNLREGRSRTRQRGGAGEYDHMTAASMEYQSQPHTEALIRAQRVISEEGLLQVIEDLQNDPLGLKYQLSEPDEIAGVPNATLTAIYTNSMQQINSVLSQMSRDGGDRKTRTWLADVFRQLEDRYRTYILPIGRASSIAGKVDKVWNGAVARRSYVEPILGHLEKVLGKKGMRFIKMMGEQLNTLMRDYSDRVVTRAEVIAELQRIATLSRTRKFQQEARKTAVMTEKRARNIVRSMAARMAEHVGMDQLGVEWADEAAQRMVKQMNGLPVTSANKTEVEIFNMAVNQVARENAESLGLRGERVPNPVSINEKMAVILKNPDLYATFVNTLQAKMIEEYKPEPGSHFANQVEEYFAWMANRAWSEGMVESLVNQNMKEFEMTFAKIAREHYSKTDENVSKLKEAVRKAMLDKGVENEGLLNSLLEDVEKSMASRIEHARLNFLGSGSGVREFLKNMQTTLSQKAKDHAMSRSDVPEKLSDWLAEDLGIPDTKDMPLASTLQQVMMQQYKTMLAEERASIVKRMVENATEGKSKEVKAKMDAGLKKLIELVNLGVFRDETAYKALQEKFKLPAYSEEIAKQAEVLGERIAIAPNDRLKGEAMQNLGMLIASQQGIRPYDMFMSGLYVNFLSGVSTHAVNTGSNAASLLGYLAVAATQDIATQRGRHIPAMLRALVRSALGSASVEFRETFFTGQRLANSGESFLPLQNVMEMQSPVFKSDISWEKGRELSERLAKWEHGLYRFLGGKWVGRALNAMDVYFYKMAQEAAFAIKTGITETHEMRSSARIEAEGQMRQMGMDWNENSDSRRKRDVLANQIINEWRLVNQNDEIDEDLRIAWVESNHEALGATFRQDPQGLLGKGAKLIETWTRGTDESPNPIGRLLVPFTRIAANVTNQMLEWTPYGLIRYGAGHSFGEDFRLRDENSKLIGRDPKILIRALLGTTSTIALMALFGQDADKEDPYLAIYDDGSKDPQLRKQMMDMGWRPKTIKVGKSYFNYSYTPFAMAFSIMGRHFDDYRDGKVTSPTDIGLASSAVAMLQAVTHQSFLSGIRDFMSATDSPNPEKNMSRLMARMASAPLEPNFVRQFDKWMNPTLQQAEGFWESFIREMPVVRNSLMPSLNVFGEKLKRDPGLDFLPGLERFLTMEKTDDPVYNLLGSKQITVPGYAKSAKLGDAVMTRDQHYQYTATAGPRVKQAIQAELPQLRAMSKEAAQERVNELARRIKEEVRREMRASS